MRGGSTDRPKSTFVGRKTPGVSAAGDVGEQGAERRRPPCKPIRARPDAAAGAKRAASRPRVVLSA